MDAFRGAPNEHAGGMGEESARNVKKLLVLHTRTDEGGSACAACWASRLSNRGSSSSFIAERLDCQRRQGCPLCLTRRTKSSCLGDLDGCAATNFKAPVGQLEPRRLEELR